MTSKQERLEELQKKTHGLNDKEMQELISLSPPGTFTKLPNLATAGLKNLNQALSNFVDVGDRSKRAFDLGCYVEVLALRSQSIELFLRLYLAAHHGMSPSFPVDDRKTLGALIAECEACGFEVSTLTDLKAFNTDRITCVHHYLLGAASYESLKTLCERSESLSQATLGVVSTRFGQVV